MIKRQEKIRIQAPGSYQRTKMQKETIIRKLKERGGRMTRQRLLLLNIILEEECSSCKEIYYKAVDRNQKVSQATVYRMINALEEIGAISRKNMYKVVCDGESAPMDVYVVEFDDGSITRLSAQSWYEVVCTGLRACGYMQNREVCSVKVRDCEDFDYCSEGDDR